MGSTPFHPVTWNQKALHKNNKKCYYQLLIWVFAPDPTWAAYSIPSHPNWGEEVPPGLESNHLAFGDVWLRACVV